MNKAARAALLTAKGIKKKRAGFDQGGYQDGPALPPRADDPSFYGSTPKREPYFGEQTFGMLYPKLKNAYDLASTATTMTPDPNNYAPEFIQRMGHAATNYGLGALNVAISPFYAAAGLMGDVAQSLGVPNASGLTRDAGAMLDQAGINPEGRMLAAFTKPTISQGANAVDAAQLAQYERFLAANTPAQDVSAFTGRQFYSPNQNELNIMKYTALTPEEATYWQNLADSDRLLQQGASAQATADTTGILRIPRVTMEGDVLGPPREHFGATPQDMAALRPDRANMPVNRDIKPEEGSNYGYFDDRPGQEHIWINPKTSAEQQAMTKGHEMTHVDEYTAGVPSGERGTAIGNVTGERIEALNSLTQRIRAASDPAEKARLSEQFTNLRKTSPTELYYRNNGEMYANAAIGDGMAKRLTPLQALNPYINQGQGLVDRALGATTQALVGETTPLMSFLERKGFPRGYADQGVHVGVPLDVSKAVIGVPPVAKNAGGRVGKSTGGALDKTSENIADYVADLLRQGRAKEVTDDLMEQADPQRLMHHYKSGNTGMDLPMDKASRMARAAQMGLTEDSLHGTLDGKDFSRFKGADRYGSRLGQENYVAPNTTDGRKLAAQFSTGDQGRIMPLLTPKPLDTSTLDDRLKFEKMMEDKNRMDDFRMKGGYRVSGLPGWGDQWAIDTVNEAGVPAMKLHERDWVTSTAVFDPTKMRSQFARFDPRLDHLAHLNASAGGAMELARAVMAKNRAGGQIAPSKYLPNVPRAVHAGGGDVEGDDDDGITAYHGSAYDFPQFDISKLGTGTGHQAKGHGLYFAGDENDAKNYREMLKDNGSIDIEHESHKLGIPLDRDAQADLRSVSRNVNGDSTLAAKALQARNLAARAMSQEKLADLIDRHRKSTTGHMYKVKLNVKPEELLDWDKPLSEQHPNVQAALSRTMPNYTIKNMAGMPHAFANGKMIEVNPNGLTGRDAYVLSRMGKSTESSNSHQDAKAASEHLLSEGIKGIRYRETGTHNYVMFHHDPVQVVDKYEYGGPVGKAGGGEVVNLGKEKLVRSITKAASDVKSGAHQERMDQRAHKLHESGHLPLPIGTKVTPPQGWDMPSELHIHGYWQDILHPEQHGYKLKSENGDLYEVQHQMHSGQNPYVFGGGFKAYSGPVRNRAGYSDEAMAHRNPILPTRTPEQSDQLNKEYDQLFGTEPDITKAEGGRIHAEGGGKMELRSKAAEAIRNQAQLKGGVDQLLAVTAKGKGVKQAELTNAGRPSGNIISKEELAKHFEDAMPQVSVERLGGADSNKYTRFEDFFLPGGKQYREHLLTLQGRENQAPYIYPWHWPDHKNVIAHIRMADRDNGETLHVGEVQSDWGQQARQRGFYDPTKPFRVYDKETKETKKLASNQFEARDEAIKSGSGYAIEPSINHHPPTGPYVGDTQQWTDLALKHILTEAAKGGHKRIVFSPGEHSADMYGQRQSAASLSLHRNPEGSNTLGTLAPYDADGFLTASGFTPVKDEQGLVDLIGKEHAAKLLASPIKSLPRSNMRVDQWQQGDPAPEPTHTLTEPDMHIGGQGMINYYQRNVNAGTLKLLRQHDPSIQSESYDLPSDPEVANGKGYKGFSLPMTDTARQSILKNGFGAFKRGGMVEGEKLNALKALSDEIERSMITKASGGAVDAALALTRRFSKDGIGATMALKTKGK